MLRDDEGCPTLIIFSNFQIPCFLSCQTAILSCIDFSFIYKTDLTPKIIILQFCRLIFQFFFPNFVHLDFVCVIIHGNTFCIPILLIFLILYHIPRVPITFHYLKMWFFFLPPPPQIIIILIIPPPPLRP